jgi:hypothetical protein
VAIDREKGVRVVTVGELLDEGLTIPSYQRPYSWEPSTALQLFDDIREAFRAEKALPNADQTQGPSYVLGAVILHRDNENVQIHVVDGQQRLLTLTGERRPYRGPADRAGGPSRSCSSSPYGVGPSCQTHGGAN